MKTKRLVISQFVSISISYASYSLVASRGIASDIIGYPSYTNFNSTSIFAKFASFMILYPLLLIIVNRILIKLTKNV